MASCHAAFAKAPLLATAIVAVAALSCRSASAEATVRDWVGAMGHSDIQAARELYDPTGWPDGHIVWERDFAAALAAGADVTFENQATFDPRRAQIVVRTRTPSMRIAWIFKLRQTEEKGWVIVNILRYFE